jgi:hypothetical protein
MDEPEQKDHACAKCGKEFTCCDEIGDDYKDYCSDCYKEMISSRYEGMDQADQEYMEYMHDGE